MEPIDDDFIVASFAETWLNKFPRIEQRGLGPRLLAALVGMSGSSDAIDDLDDVEEIAAALVELIAMLKGSPAGVVSQFPMLFGKALKGKGGLS
ncbi:MAG TPA: hypothetical protein VK745_31960 [Polyangiaceae bacterium]|jgi:hypothetical protein|nr:hypothetical protein [Polyangiaceae bacterium]